MYIYTLCLTSALCLKPKVTDTTMLYIYIYIYIGNISS